MAIRTDYRVGSGRKATGRINPAVERSVLEDLAGYAGGTLGTIAHVIDTPGAMVRGALAGGLGNGVAALYQSSEDRTDGRELLRSYGLLKGDDTWLNWAAGLGTELLTDPLSMLSGPARALTPAGKAAKAAGLSGQTARAVSRAYLDDAARVAPEIADRAAKGVDRLTKTRQGTARTMTDTDLYSKPLVGPRAASRFGTLDDVVRYADDPKTARDDVIQFLGRGDVARGEQIFNQIKGQNLSNDIGVGLPLGDAAYTFNLGAVGTTYRDLLDAMGRSARWSWLGRAKAKLFDKSVDSALDEEAQMLQQAGFAKRAAARQAKTRETAEQISKLHSEVPEAFTEDGNKFLGRLIEGSGQDFAATRGFYNAHPAVRRLIDWWEDAQQQVLKESREIGLASNKLEDPYGLNYLPYQADSMFQMASRSNPKLRSSLSHLTGDQLGRTASMRTPGGRDQIMRLSQDPQVSGPQRALSTDAAAAAYLARDVHGTSFKNLTKQQQKEMLRLANILHGLPKEATDIAPLFGQHPMQMIQQYMVGRGEAAANLDVVLDGLVTYAVRQKPTHVQGGRHVTISQALKELDAKTVKAAGPNVTGRPGVEIGARPQMRERLAKAMGITPDKVNLSAISVPREHLDKLLRAREGLVNPTQTNSVMQWLDAYTSVWKGSILAWPSRITRDLYSGAYANWLAGAFSPDAAWGAKVLLEHGADSPEFARFLDRLPRYSGIANRVDRAAAFNADLVSTGLLGGGSHLDRFDSVTGKEVLQQFPGAESATFSGAVGELFNPQGYKWENFSAIKTPKNPYAQTRNPILLAGDKANTVSDGINRLTGYYALLQQGYSPMAAAEQIKRVQVDYGSLSDFERTWMRHVFPWYTYQSRIFGEVVSQLAARPGGRYGQTIRTVNRGQQDADDETYIPSYLREQVAIPVGRLPQGQVYVSDIDLPGFDQLNMLELPGPGRDIVTGTARQIGEQLSPTYRIAAELISGRDFYHDTPIKESYGIASQAGRFLTGQPLPYGYLADRVIGNVPFVQRPATAISKVLDDRTGLSLLPRIGTTALDQVTGVKVRTVSDERNEYDMSSLIGETIDTLPQSRTMSRTYIPEELQGTLPQWAIDRLEMQQELDRRRRARATRQ